MARALALMVLILVWSCSDRSGHSGDGDGRSGADDGDLTDCSGERGVGEEGEVGDAAAEVGLEPLFAHEVLEFTQGAGLSGSATGAFAKPAIEYSSIPIEPKFEHLLNFQITPFMPPWRLSLPTHGPLLLYSDDFDTILVSPMDQFFSTLIWYEDGAVHIGLHGDIDSTPPDFRHRFLIVSGHGISATFREWGRLLLEDRGKARVDRYTDVGVSHLGYWTDNGAYYYYKKEDGLSEQDTLLALKADLDAMAIPVGYMQLDSWWYFKDGTAGLWPPAGLILWEPRPEVFPDGLTEFHEAVGLPLVLHNRWFNGVNDYLDEYEFVVEGPMALPVGQDVFDHFMQDAAGWGAVTYEQDWLVTQYWGLSHLRSAPGSAEAWMGHIDAAAHDSGLSVQLCMEGAAHLMDSVDRSSYVTVRTSTDYHKDISKETWWPQFHIVNMLASALGLLPFKDNFQSSEVHGEAEALITALSAGMAGMGDGIGQAVPDIVMRLCRVDGLLLKPDVPAAPIDDMFIPHERPFIVATRSARTDLGTTAYVAAFLLAREHPERTGFDRAWALVSYDGQDVGDMFVFPVEVTDWHLDLAEVGASGQMVAYDWSAGTASVVEGSLSMSPIEHLYGFRYLVLAPVQPNGLAFLGETGKYVTVSDRRFTSVQATQDGFVVSVEGVPGESVELLAFDALSGKLLDPVTAKIPGSGIASIELARAPHI